MRSLIRRFLPGGLLIVATIAVAASAPAANFGKTTLKGSYSFLITLWTANPNAAERAAIGVMTFDGAGHVAGSYTSVIAGVVQDGMLGGSYTVKSNGTGTIDLTTGVTAQFAVILNSTAAGVARGIQLLQTNDANNEIVSGTALLQSATVETYSAASLKGNFAFQFNTWNADADLGEEGSIFILTFDGNGNGTFVSGTDIYRGKSIKIKSGSGSVTYTVNSDGSGSIFYPAHQAAEFAFAVNSVAAGQAAALQFLSTEQTDNKVYAGVALKQ